MTDRELLEAAAKAAGIKVPTKKDYPYAYIDERGIHKDISCGGDGTRMSHWNPLTNDGDALRLAMKLRIEVEPWIHGDSECARAAVREVLIDEPHYGGDPERATRRAIVRAAAEIGRSKT